MPRGSFTHVSTRTIATLAAAMIVVAAVAADVPVASPELPEATAGASVQSGIPGCAVWTDRCVTCQREGGAIACSNIGFACQPQALQCVRAEVEKKPANGDPPP
jgi:hypothetical protein